MVSGLSGDIDEYLVYLSENETGQYASEAYGGTEPSTTLYWSDMDRYLTNGYYLVREFSNQRIDSAISCALTVTQRGDWAKCSITEA